MIFDVFVKTMRELSPHRHYLLALSGGLDSSVLVNLLSRFTTNENATLRVIHIHHGLSPNADAWENFCRELCRHYSIPFACEKITLNFQAKRGLEAEARTKRYQVFLKHLLENEILLTAHTQSDQAETLLLQLLRGAGSKGLSAMPAKKAFGAHEHIRPLLNFSREDLEAYAKMHQLSWIEDESNQDVRFDRNFLRHSIIPSLRNRWPAVSAHLANAARHFSESAELFENLADIDLSSALTDCVFQIKIEPLLKLSLLRQKNALRRFFQLNNALMPDRKRLSQIIETIFFSGKDKNPCIRWDNIELHRFQGRLYLISRLAPFDVQGILSWDFLSPLSLPGGFGMLIAEKKEGLGIRADLDAQKISVRFRQGGEVIKWHGQTQALKTLFHAWKIPPWERDRIPFIFYGEELISVVGYAVADNYFSTGINISTGFVLRIVGW
jgi:tRNA(Ile)-lysidine synthase